MIIFTQRYNFNYTIIFRYTTVDKVADDKEKELESQSKKSKQSKQEDEAGINVYQIINYRCL